MKNVLIPYDFSEAAINALNYTKKMFEKTSINIYLLGVYVSNTSKLLSQEKNDAWFNVIDDDIEEELNFLITILKNENKGFKYSGLVVADSLTKAIEKEIVRNEIDIVISGTKGIKNVHENYIGTNTIKIINSVKNTPVLVIPTDYKYDLMKTVVFSTNYKRHFIKKELNFFLKIISIKNANIEVLNLSNEKTFTDKQRKHKVQLRETLQDFSVVYKKLDSNYSEVETIEQYIREKEHALLVLVNHKANFFSRLIEENVVKKSVFHSKIPLLILPEKNE